MNPRQVDPLEELNNSIRSACRAHFYLNCSGLSCFLVMDTKNVNFSELNNLQSLQGASQGSMFTTIHWDYLLLYRYLVFTNLNAFEVNVLTLK